MQYNSERFHQNITKWPITLLMRAYFLRSATRVKDKSGKYQDEYGIAPCQNFPIVLKAQSALKENNKKMTAPQIAKRSEGLIYKVCLGGSPLIN